MRDSGDFPSVAAAAGTLPEEIPFRARLRELERARRRRRFLSRFALALPVSAAGAAAGVVAFDAALAAGIVRAAAAPAAAPRYAVALAAAFAGAAIAARLGLRSEGAFRRVAADADRRFGLADRAASAVDVLAAGGARCAAGSMGALVVRDALGRIPSGAGRALYAAPPLVRPVLVALLVSAAALLPLALRHPSIARLLREDARSAEGEPKPETTAPPLVLAVLEPDEGFSGSSVVAAVEGLAPGSVFLRFGSREVAAVVSIAGEPGLRRAEIEATVPTDLPLGVTSVVVRQARRRSNALPFIVLPPPPGEGAGGPEGDENESPSDAPTPDLTAAPPPPPAGAGPDATEKPREREEPKKTIPRFVLPLESPDGERRVKEAFALEPDPENRPATETIPGGESPGPGGEGSPFKKAAEDAVRRPDLRERDRAVVRRYFERLDSSAAGSAGSERRDRERR